MYGLDAYADRPYGDDGAPTGPSTTPLVADSFAREVLSNATGVAYVDALTREVVSNGTGIAYVDAITRELVSHGTGIAYLDSINREVVGKGLGIIYADVLVREILLVPIPGIMGGSIVREILANGGKAYHDIVSDGGANPRDSLTGLNTYAYTLTEAANATDRLRLVPSSRKALAYTPLPQNHPDPLVRDIQEKVNAIQQGRTNTGIDITLNDSTSTTFVDNRISPFSKIHTEATDASAAGVVQWIERQQGQLIIHHTAAGMDDAPRTIMLTILGT